MTGPNVLNSRRFGNTAPEPDHDPTPAQSPTSTVPSAPPTWRTANPASSAVAATGTPIAVVSVGAVFDGRLIERDSAAYEAARIDAIFNMRRPARFPSAVLQAASEADVVAGVRLARDRGWGVTVRSGGHSWGAWSLHDDAILIDLSGLREMTISAHGTATVSPSIRGGAEFSPFIRSRGYLFPGGHCPTVGLGGYLLQGGQGWNGRPWGWACESVLAVDVVTADGELVHASAGSHPDLYWAARGAGPGFFGAVTRFHLRLFDLPRVFVQTAYALPIDYFDDVLRWAHGVLPTLDRRVEPVIVGTRIPPEGVDIGGAPMMIMLSTGLFDSQDEADRLMQPLQGCPGLDHAYMREFAAPVTFDIVGAIQEAMSPSGHRYAADCAWTDATADDLAPLLRDLYTTLPTPQSFTIWYGWNPVRPLPDMAFSMEANVYLATYAVWSDPADDARVTRWVTERYRALEPVSKGTYLGDADLLSRPAPFMAAENYARLAAIRDQYDPQRRFPGFRVKPGANPNEFEAPDPA